MRAAGVLVALVCVFSACPSAVQAATHPVQVLDFDAFLPTDISINKSSNDGRNLIGIILRN